MVDPVQHAGRYYVSAFEYTTTPSVIFGAGSVKKAGGLVRERLAAKKVLVVSDQGILDAGLLNGLKQSLKEAGAAVEVFKDISSDPAEEEILKGADRAKECGADAIIGLGGGSPMDGAKAIAILSVSKQPIADLYGLDKVEGTRLPLLLIPTTAGTGSEATPYAVITRPSGDKISITCRQSYPDIAILDPELTLGLPGKLTAATGIDAMVHAIEAYTSKGNKSVLSDLAAEKGLELLWAALPKVLADGSDIRARGDMLLGAFLAGQAIATAPVGGVHTLAYPLGGLHHVHHGLSNSLVLPPVMRFNAKMACPLYAKLASIILPGLKGADEAKAEAFITAVEDMIALTGLETRLTQIGINHNHIPKLVEEAMKLERLLKNNPAAIDAATARALYEEIL